jgi:acetyl-CoA C-acetyltransferase
MGQVLTAGAGQNPARQAAVEAGVPADVPAWIVNQVCGSGPRSVVIAGQSVMTGDSEIAVAGGQESMSQAPHLAHLRQGKKMGDVALADSMLRDGLWCALNGYHMGQTAENVARTFGVDRTKQDEFAARSQNRAEAARENGRFREEIVPVTVSSRKGETIVKADEHIREGVTPEALAELKPAFDKEGSVTAGNASGINDGAAATVLMSGQAAARRGLTPMARIVSWAQAGVDPAVMGTGPIPASRRALEKAGWRAGDLDLIEVNEAFAAQAVAVNAEMGWDPDRVNVNGGAIALVHPIGASGTRIFVTLLHEMVRRDAKKGLATLCIGGGMGIALCVERD